MGKETGTREREGARDLPLRERRGQETGTRERGGQRLAPEREGARNWHLRKKGP